MTKSHNAIFLDIDGVLNGAKTGSKAPSSIRGISNSKLDIFSKFYHNLKDENGDKYQLILSSTWRRCLHSSNNRIIAADQDGQYLLDKFAKFRLPIDGITPSDTSDSYRGRQICDYRDANGIGYYICIDDEIFPDFAEYGVTEHLIQTNDETGIRANTFTEILAELNEHHKLMNNCTRDEKIEDDLEL